MSARDLRLVVTLFLAMAVGITFFVWAVTKTIPRLTTAYDAAGLIARRRELLRRARAITSADIEELRTLTRKLRDMVTADHVVAAVDAELEAIAMAALAVDRGDHDRAREFLRRVGHRTIGARVWSDAGER